MVGFIEKGRTTTACNLKTIFVSLKAKDDVYMYLKHDNGEGDLLYANAGYGLPSFGGIPHYAD